MISFTDIIILFASGCAGGIISGLLGVGGGVIYVVVLGYYFERLGIRNIELVRFILSNSFFAIFFASVIGSIQQIRNKNFFPKEVAGVTVTAIVGSVITSFLIVKFNWYNKTMFSTFFVVALTILMIRMFLTTRNKNEKVFVDTIPQFKYPLIGIFTGIFSALSGLGGGVITVPFLADLNHLKIKKATSISLGAMPFMTVASALFYSQWTSGSGVEKTFGYLIPGITLPLVAGVIITSSFGVKLSKKLSEITIRYLFAAIMLLVIVRMLYSILF